MLARRQLEAAQQGISMEQPFRIHNLKIAPSVSAFLSSFFLKS